MNRISARTTVLLAVLLPSALVLGQLQAGARDGWVHPIGPPGSPADVVRGFDPPDRPWLSGHRGVDLAAIAGSEVRAAGAGRVTYAGLLAGRGVVVVDHGALRTTYEPVSVVVAVGDTVDAGDPIGTLSAMGSHCAPAACLHWGARRGSSYRNPMDLVGFGDVRLLPLGDRTISGAPPPAPGLPAGSRLGWPLSVPRVTSPYGMRVHPVTGDYKLHDGTDFGAACGTPVRAAAAGRVTHAGSRGPYGMQVTLGHGLVGGVAMTTSYSHLSAHLVSAGQRVGAGQAVGRVGSTGSSTGCHLHFMVYADGSLADPMHWLSTTSATPPPAKRARAHEVRSAGSAGDGRRATGDGRRATGAPNMTWTSYDRF